ncbi:mannan endo-1,6-alpha-mannosidase [Aspergillus californicus]
MRLSILGALLPFLGRIAALEITLSDSQTIKDAASKTAYGSLGWYAGNETGQIPGSFPEKWWEGSALFMSLLFYWFYTDDSQYNDLVSQGMQWQAGNGDYMPGNYSSYLGNDDQFFWGAAAMLAAEMNFPDVDDGYSWLSLAQGVFNSQVERWDTTNCGGGLRWQLYPYQAGYLMKNSISNGGLFQLAGRLARYTANDTYADWADKIWDWTASTPLLNNQTWNVADSVDINDDCSTQGNNQWSYNYGAYLTGAAYMYNYTEKAEWKTRVNGLLGVLLDTFFPDNMGDGKIFAEYLCEPKELCNYNEILFKGIVSTWLSAVAIIVPETYEQIFPKLQTSAQAAALSCSGSNNNTCGVRWYQSKWDGWTGMEEQIIATDILTSVLISDKTDGPLTSSTGGNSSSDPNAGLSSGSGSEPGTEKKITAGDKAGASILTVLFVAAWGSMIGWMVLGEPS